MEEVFNCGAHAVGATHTYDGTNDAGVTWSLPNSGWSIPTHPPSEEPTALPTRLPTAVPTTTPTEFPTPSPTSTPTEVPTTLPPTTTDPSFSPTITPTESPTAVPSATPTEVPTTLPTASPSFAPSTATASASFCATCSGNCVFDGEWDEVGVGASGCHSSNGIHGSDKRWILSKSTTGGINAHCPGYADYTNQPNNRLNSGCFQIWGRRMCLSADRTLMYGPGNIVWKKRGTSTTDFTHRNPAQCTGVPPLPTASPSFAPSTVTATASFCATCSGNCVLDGEWDEVGVGASGCHSSNGIHGSDKRWILSPSTTGGINAHCPG